MDYCGPQGIPHSLFLRWSQDDQDKALAWVVDNWARCQRCGSYTDEWVNEDGRPVQPPPMFARAVRCQGCVTLESEEELIRKTSGGKMPSGMRVYMSRQPPPPQDLDEEDDT
jgi:hypothetical protein